MAFLYNKQHITRRAQPDILEICQPLFKQLKLNYFEFIRVFKDGSFFALFSQMDWHDYFYTKGFRSTIPLQKQQQTQLSINKQYISLWDGVVNENIVRDASTLFNLKNPIAINNVSPNHIDSFSFAGISDQTTVLNTYVSDLDTLIQFTQHFYFKAAPLIKQAHQHKIVPPKQYAPLEAQLLKKLITKTKITGFKGDVNLTLKELETLTLFLAGLSSKEIAMLLNRSSRTIESHINAIKNKLGCFKRSQIYYIALSNGIKPCLPHSSSIKH